MRNMVHRTQRRNAHAVPSNSRTRAPFTMSRFTRACVNETIRAPAANFFPWRCIKHRFSSPPDVQIYPNKFWCAWLGQGGGMKVVWKGFGRSIKMKENFADLIFQNFCSKRLKIDRFLVEIDSSFSIVGSRLWLTPPKRTR